MTILVMLLLLIVLIVIGFIAPTRIRISLGKTRLVVAFYLALLLVSVPVYYAIAEPVAPGPPPEPNKDVPIEEQHYHYDVQINAFYEALNEGRLTEYEGAELIGRWSFDYEEDRMRITAPDYQRYWTLIAVERESTRDGKLEMLSYAPKPPTGLVLHNPPHVRLQGDQLVITQPELVRLEEARFHHDFTMAQFTGLGFSPAQMSHIHFGHEPVLYLLIPENLRIETDTSSENLVQFVNE